MKEVYIFDMDGVLVDSEAYYHKLRLEFLKKYDLSTPYTNINDYLGIDYDLEWKMLVQDSKQRPQLLPKFDSYWAENNINYSEYLNEQVPDFLAELKKAGKTVALASAGKLRGVNQMLDECDLRQYFDSVLSGENVRHNKPAPDIYLQSAQKLNVNPEQCIALEDSTIGISSAKSAGVETWAIEYPQYRVDQTAADHKFKGFGQVREYFQTLIGE